MTGSLQVGHDAGYYTRGGESRDTYYTGAGTTGDGLASLSAAGLPQMAGRTRLV